MLEVKAIDTYRGPAHILHGVSLNVGANEVVCLVGRNGAGKTTTIESIMGFLPQRAGEITFGGEVINKLPPHERAAGIILACRAQVRDDTAIRRIDLPE